MSSYIKSIEYQTSLPFGAHWSLRARRGSVMKLSDLNGSANVGMLFYNPENLLERYNAPDTLKCQHTFKLGKGHCLYSDMGRVFASIVEDSSGWHDSVCGNSRASHIENNWGLRDYQNDQNNWKQNGHDAFLVELAKYGLGAADLASNVNWFSQVRADEHGVLSLADKKSGSEKEHITLRFEMDTLVLLHTCPHPLNASEKYPKGEVKIELGVAEKIEEDDFCKNFCAENARGFKNNDLYYIGRGV